MKKPLTADEKMIAQVAEALDDMTPGELNSRHADIAIRITQRLRSILFEPRAASYADAHAFVILRNNARRLLELAARGAAL